MFYSTNQSYHWKLNQSEVAISGRLANQIVTIEPISRELTCNTSASEQYIRFFIFFSIFSFFSFHFFYISLIISHIIFHTTFSTSNNTKLCTMVVASTGFSKSLVTIYNDVSWFHPLIFVLAFFYIFHIISLFNLPFFCIFPIVSLFSSVFFISFPSFLYHFTFQLSFFPYFPFICPFPAILFSLFVSYNLIIFYELALSLVICPFPAILFS